MGIPLYMTLFFLLSLEFSIFKFSHFNCNMSWCGSVCFISFGTVSASNTFISVSLYRFWEVFNYNLFKYILIPFSHSSPSGTSITQMLVCIMLSHRSLKLYSFLFKIFLLIGWFPLFNTRSLIHSFVSLSLLSILYSVCVCFLIHLLNSSLLSLFNIFLFLVKICIMYIYSFPYSVNIFTDALDSLYGQLFISVSLFFSGFSLFFQLLAVSLPLILLNTLCLYEFR